MKLTSERQTRRIQSYLRHKAMGKHLTSLQIRRLVTSLGLTTLMIAARTAEGTCIPPTFEVPSVVTTCSTCADLNSLAAFASEYLTKWYMQMPAGYTETAPSIGVPCGREPVVEVGTVIVVISTREPISGSFIVQLIAPSGPEAIEYGTTTNISTADLDGQMIARAEVPPPKLTVPHNPDTIEIAIENIQQYLITSGGIGYSLWHGLTNFPQIAYQTVYDTQNGQTYQVYVGDTITVQYSDGWTDKFEFLGTMGGTLQWQEVQNALRDPDGNPPSNSSPTPPTSSNTDPVPHAEVSFDSAIGTVTAIPLVPSDNDSDGPAGHVIVEQIEGGDSSADYEQD